MPPKRGRSASAAGPSPRKRKGAPKPAAAAESSQENAFSRYTHAVLGFLGITVCSLGLSTALFSLSVSITQGDLAWTSKHLDSWWHVVGFLAWRVVEIGACCAFGYDGYDVLALNTHAQIPTYVFLGHFYLIRPTTVLTVLGISNLSAAAPFYFFRPESAVRSTAFESRPFMVRDKLIATYTTTLATSVYTVAVYTSYATWIPKFLIVHFDGLPDLRVAHQGPSGFVPMFISFLCIGYAAREFLFVGSAGHPQADETGTQYEERPGELLVSSIYRRAWVPLPVKTKILISRTCVMTTITMTNSIVQLLGTVNGADLTGALGWAGIWAVSTNAVAGIYAWMEAAD